MNFDFLTLTERLERVHSQRLALRQVSLSDGWPLFRATRNPQFNKHLLWQQPASESEVFQRVDAIIQASLRGRMSALSAVAKDSGEWVALFRFQPDQSDATATRALEMGVWVHDRFWHGRYSLEIGRLCVDACFDLSPADRLVGAAAPANRSSCHLMMHVGMSPTRLVTRATESGASVELQEYELTRPDWEADTKPVVFDAVHWEAAEPLAAYRVAPEAAVAERVSVTA